MSAAVAPPRAVLKAGRETPFFFGHPWVFSGALDRVEGRPGDGAEVPLCSHDGQFIAWGLFNPKSQIVLRLYSWKEGSPLSDAFWKARLSAAVRLRKDLPGLTGPQAACRLVFSEADGLSGLIADRYGEVLVVQFTGLAMAQRKDLLLDCLEAEAGTSVLYLRTEKGIREAEGLAIEDGLLRGNPASGSVTISENGLLFEVNFKTGHKTGFYLDQRDNRRRAAEFAAGKKCLDLFCYSGGFALNLARAGAREVVGIDSSEAALALANGNAKLNGLSKVSFMKEDAERAMQSFLAQHIRFDLVILDPPRFAQSTPGVRQALKAYARLNTLAAELLNPGGTLVSCSCSGRVSRRDFLSMLSAVSLETNRPLRVLEQRGAAPDHPVNVACPESDYLKCFICRVE